jgi:hypothetical protein
MSEQEKKAAESKQQKRSAKEQHELQQQHNSAVEHGGVTQIGDFDVEKQKEEREKLEEENADKGYLNEFDPALPTVDEGDLGDDADEDRDSAENAKKQGEVPGS